MRVRTKTKSVLAIVAAFAAGMALAQLVSGGLYYSFLISTTNVDVHTIPRLTSHPLTIQIKRPFTRYLPFIKFGETTYIRTDEVGRASEAVYEKIATTRTKLFVFGFCTVDKYDALADVPYETASRRDTPDDGKSKHESNADDISPRTGQPDTVRERDLATQAHSELVDRAS